MDDVRTQQAAAPRIASETEVLQALATLHQGHVVATDADNTLWSGDVGDELVRRAATPPYAPWHPGDADLPWYVEEMERDYPRACRYAAEVLLKTVAAPARTAIHEAIRDRVKPRRWLIEALQQAMARGVQVVIVSASPRLAVEIGAELFGLQACPILAVDCLSLQPLGFVEPVPIGQGKVEAWLASGRGVPDVALGDSVWDGPLLQSARVGLLVQRACEDPRCDQPRQP